MPNKLKSVVCFFRHSNRNPSTKMFNKNCKFSRGVLTEKGIAECKKSAIKFQNQYKTFLSTLKPGEVKGYSSKVDRCILSLKTKLQTLGLPTNNLSIQENLFMGHLIKFKVEYDYSRQKSAEYKALEAEIKTILENNPEFDQFFSRLTVLRPYSKNVLDQFYYIYDYLHTEASPSPLLTKSHLKAKSLSEGYKAKYFKATLLNSTSSYKIPNYLLLRELTAILEGKPKLTFFSAHDFNLTCLVKLLSGQDKPVIGFNDELRLEETESGVKLFFNDSALPLFNSESLEKQALIKKIKRSNKHPADLINLP